MPDLFDAAGTVNLRTQPATASGAGSLAGLFNLSDAPGTVSLRTQPATVSGDGSIGGLLLLGDAPGTVSIRTQPATVSGDGSLVLGGPAADLQDAPGRVDLRARHALLTGEGELIEFLPPGARTGFGELFAQPASVDGLNAVQLNDGPGVVYLRAGAAQVVGSGIIPQMMEDVGTPADLFAQQATIDATATIKGSAEVLTGTGELLSQAATTDATGARGLVGVAYIEAGFASVSSPGKLGVNANGQIYAQEAMVSGDGQKGVKGTGELYAQPAQTSAQEREIDISGVGELYARVTHVDGQGVRVLRGAGELPAQPATLQAGGRIVRAGGTLPPYDQTVIRPGVARWPLPSTAFTFPAAVAFTTVRRISLDLDGTGWLANETVIVWAPDNQTPLCSLSFNRDQVEAVSGDAFDQIAAAIVAGQPFSLYLSAYRSTGGLVTFRDITHPVSVRLMVSGVAA